MTASSTTHCLPKLPNFIFTEKIGSGTYASVYKAYRKDGTRETVAIKCISKSSLNKVATENLLTEIELLKMLKHENIVELYDFTWDEHSIYLIMEYCRGGDLSLFIQSKRVLSETVARRCLQQLASALHYMRSKNVSHMDLKPQNILLSRSSQPVLKIADFGFAHYLIGETNAFILRGSPLYMAPEIILNRHYDEKADLWSVGVILYECLFGQAPFVSKSLDELEEKIRDSRPIQLPYGVTISESCRSLLHGLLQRDPSKRMSFDEFLAHPFVDFEHRPDAEAVTKARQYAERATKADADQRWKDAIDLYCRSVQYLSAALHYEQNTSKKESLQIKMKEYLGRAEELKQLMKPQRQQDDDHRCNSATRQSLLGELAESSAEFYNVLQNIQKARDMAANEQFPESLSWYERALDSAISILHEERKGERKDRLQKQVSLWLSEAEKIKRYLEVKDIGNDTSSMSSSVDNSQWSTCAIQ